MESRGATIQDLLPYVGGQGMRKVYMEGDLGAGLAYCGEVVGLIHDIPTVKEVVDRIVKGTVLIQERMAGICRT